MRRHQLGQVIPFLVQCVDSSGTPYFPDDCPTLKIWSSSGVVFCGKMPCEDRFVEAGIFLASIFLGSDYAVGKYTWAIYYKADGYYGIETGNFQILAGGSSDGDVVSQYFYDRPHGKFLVQELTSGNMISGRNPK